jgi:hypothetical protein
MAQKKNNVVSKVVDWTARIQKQADLIVSHNCNLLLIKNLHNQLYGNFVTDTQFTSKRLFQSLVLSYIRDNHFDIYEQAILK